MSEINEKNLDVRRKRVNRLKKLIVSTLMILIITPIVICITLLFRVAKLERQIEDLSKQVENLRDDIAGMDSSGMEEALHMQDEVMDSPEEIPDGLSSGIPDSYDEYKHKVYLTFDDGPSIYTDDILDILDEYGVKATFFVVGKEDEASKAAIKDIVDRGHTLGMHSYSHRYGEIYQSTDAFSEDFFKLQDYLQELTGQKCRFYRFPGGSSNTVSDIDMHEFADFLKEQGVLYYDWNVSSGDATNKKISVDTLVANSIEGIEERGTSIILMHDSAEKRTTVDALPQIIENILNMDDTVILPITEATAELHHIQ